MQPFLPPELLTAAEMAKADRLTIARGIPEMDLMEAAGAVVAEAARACLPLHGRRIFTLCGPGNNGGDGFVAARLLREAGFDVAVSLLGRPEALKGAAADAFRRWGGFLHPWSPQALEDADLVIDALFGAGLSRDLDSQYREAVEALNGWSARTRRPVLAVDLPSGVDSDTGAIRGAAVQASATATFFRLKPGHLLLPGRGLCGRTILRDIGIAPAVLADIAPRVFANTPALWGGACPVPTASGHKYTRGHALVATGGATTTGAGRLAARSALRIGAGLLTVASPRAALAANAAHLTAVMLQACDSPDELAGLLADARRNAFLIGPGFGVGPATRAMVAAALAPAARPRAVTLDADALTSFADRPEALRGLIAAAPGPVVLMPHEGEFARLFQSSGALSGGIDTGPKSSGSESTQGSSGSDSTRASRIERARRASAAIGGTLILKGPDTIVAAPDGRASIAANAPPWLATAGSGDVLAGFVTGLMAQGMPAFEAASAAVWLHGEAGVAFGPGLIAEDLPEALPGVLARLFASLAQAT